MSPGLRAAALLGATAGLAAIPLVVAAGPQAHFRDGPPAAVTGGFGQDSCHACHFDGAADDGHGTLIVKGLPHGFEPGETYRLEIVLARPGMAVGGFQLSARHGKEGTQAGTLAPAPEDEARIGILVEREIQYIQHVLEGIALSAPDTVRWAVLWTAPGESIPVTLSAAAVAGDDDRSPFGDHVYTTELQAKPDGG